MIGPIPVGIKKWKLVVLAVTGLFVVLFLLALALSSGDPRTGGADIFASIRKSILRWSNEVGAYDYPTNFGGGLPLVPCGGQSVSGKNGDGKIDFVVERFREPVYRPFWRRVGERVRIVLSGPIVERILGMRLVAKTGVVVDAFVPSPLSEVASVGGYIDDESGGYEIHLLYRDTKKWDFAWAWSWGLR